jgi:hypothetical protein
MRSELESPQDQRCWSVIAQIHRLHLGRSETPPQIKQELKYGHLIEVKRLFSKRSAAILSPQFVQQIDRQRTLVQRLSFSNLHSMSVNRRQRRTKKTKQNYPGERLSPELSKESMELQSAAARPIRQLQAVQYFLAADKRAASDQAQPPVASPSK